MKSRLRNTIILLFIVTVFPLYWARGTDSREKTVITLFPVCARAEAAVETAGTEYEPTSFSFSGGSGKMKISCPRVVVDEEGARAELIFQSEHVISVRVGDISYDTISEGKASRTPLIPVTLEEDCEVAALTTAMSEPHEIVYTLHISISGDGGGSGRADADNGAGSDAGDGAVVRSGEHPVPALPGLTFEEKFVPGYAEGFAIYYDRSDCRLIDVFQEGLYLVLPSEMELSQGISEDVTVIRLSPECIYLANTAAMSLFDAMNATDAVKLCSLTADNWYLDAPKEAMQAGKMQFAGKYSEPDYELLVESGCDLAIENTMIYHAPEVREMLEELGIPVFVDRSSYEPHPLGRTEWIRVYAAMLGMESEADSFFREQEALAEEAGRKESTGKTVAVFSVNTNGSIVIRKRDDYIPNMLRMAGWKYVFDELPGTEGSGSMNLTLEEFYALAGDADCLLYNAAIEYAPESTEALAAVNPLFAELKAVRKGQVWTTQKSLYQSMGATAEIIMDFSRMLDGSGEGTTYVTKLAGKSL